ncbi:ubiquitinyl hydrolase [Gonapodya prolifera JEL478]|uniref:Ubiquitin carboxyl-terminal hydrolase n=1 Tax=Gonapodya prolifera (strain JEL478) TaxID=1344416 RepID=A0A139A9G5_GONPJ|nr:ubiquitinyl hydrolase [Gonapodya prolifera JEL478]|eukprot:KXS13406.1 ubiquitinyl hydrolase [Gonapodya prolifera JEL478]
MATTCPHATSLASTLAPPSLNTPVYKDESVQCFDNQDFDTGICVCLHCFNGGCLDTDRRHAMTHAHLHGHPLALNVRRVPKPRPAAEEEEPPQKMTKLEIKVEIEEEMYDWHTKLVCCECGKDEPVELDEAKFPGLRRLADVVMTSLSAAKRSEIKAWEEEVKPCEHCDHLEQESSVGKVSAEGAHCSLCDLSNNLWLCLTCGNLGCGRRQYDGSGGNGHASDHYAATMHPLAVKLGTITPEGTADIYCYLHDDGVLDPHLAKHLSRFGIDVAAQTKTEKSVAELQLEKNLAFDFSMVTEDGKALEPLFGPGYTGLKNLGNSCYMASVLQSLFSIEPFAERYIELAYTHPTTSHAHTRPGECFHCQMAKVADGLLSGRYSHPPEGAAEEEGHGQEGVAPRGFKEMAGKDHVEFSSMRQQDAFEFLQHLLRLIQQRERSHNVDPTTIFNFQLEQRLECRTCHGVRYQRTRDSAITVPVPPRVLSRKIGEDGKEVVEYEPIQLDECVARLCGEEDVHFECPNGHRGIASKVTRFVTFPDYLVVQATRFVFENWVPKKLTIPLVVPQEYNMETYRSEGKRPGETILPEAPSSPSASSGPQFNQAALEQLMAMGFPDVRCKKALLATGNADPEAAMNWLFGHMDDPDIDDPIPDAAPASGGASVNEGDLAMLMDMGFSKAQATKALRETSNNTERAVEWLFSHPDDPGDDGASSVAPAAPVEPDVDTLPARFQLVSFINHKGSSVHAGHYVAHVWKEGNWVLFNDEKVVHATNPPVQDAYVYVFKRLK